MKTLRYIIIFVVAIRGLVMGCFGYLLASVTFLLFPSYGEIVFTYATIPSALAEISIILWLLMKGVRVEKKVVYVQVN